MKKITLLAALFLACFVQAQISSGVIPLTSSYSASIDVNDTTVEITLSGDENRFMGLGFDVTSMTSGGDVVTFDSTGFNDRAFMGIGIPPVLDTQDWTMSSNTVTGGVRTVVASRPLAGSDSTDFTFDPSMSVLDIVWSNGTSLNLQNHGPGNRGITSLQFSLGIDGVLTQSISLFPVPAKDILTLNLQNFDVVNATVNVYNTLGTLVLSQNLDHKSSILNVGDLAAGIYVVKVAADNGSLTTRFIKE